VSIQAQIINLFSDLRDDRGASRFCLSPTTSGWWSIYVTMWR
jgi:ABC-type oligopeptide transport system ATPase subunit